MVRGQLKADDQNAMMVGVLLPLVGHLYLISVILVDAVAIIGTALFVEDL